MADGIDNEGVAEKLIAIPLYGFHYLHSPYDENIKDSLRLFTGRDALINRLVSLIECNERVRGSYLIAGYRGAGKTSIVNRVIGKYDPNYRKTQDHPKVVVIKINLGDQDSTRLTPIDIYFSIATFLREKVSGRNKDNDIKKLDELIERIGYEISESRNIGKSASVKFGADSGAMLNFFANIKSILDGKVDISNINSKKLLPVSAREVEDRLLNILESVNDLKIILIFDEIDKLSNSEEFASHSHYEIDSEKAQQDKHARVNSLLGSLKNFITTARATFFFISGRETLDRYYSEKGSHNSLYESLFDSVFEVPSLLTDERHYLSRFWRIGLLVEEYLCRRLRKYEGDFEGDDAKDYFTLKKYHHDFVSANTDDKSHSDGRILINTLRNFVYYLTFHSWGSPKRLSSILESFIVPNSTLSMLQSNIKKLENVKFSKNPSSECHYWLLFEINHLRAFSLAAELVILFEHQFSREVSKVSDQLTVTSLASLQYILKHHSYGFSRESLNRMSEALNVHRSPALNAIVDDLLAQTFKPYIRRIRNGIYRYRFHSGFEQELRYISQITPLESATYNFSLDSMRHVKKFFENRLHAIDEAGRSSTWHSHISLGDICALEQSYNEASAHYCSAIRLLKSKVDKSDRSTNMEFLMQYAEVMAKNGDLEEHRQNYHRAASIYAEAERLISDIVDKNTNLKHRLLKGDSKWDMLKQPFWAGHFLSLKRSQSSGESLCRGNLYSETDRRYDLRAATLLFFSGCIGSAKSHYENIAKHSNLNDSSSERDAYLEANALSGMAEAMLLELAHNFTELQHGTSRKNAPDAKETPEFLNELMDFLGNQFNSTTAFLSSTDAMSNLWNAAQVFENHRIYINAAITYMKVIGYLSSMLDAFSDKRIIDTTAEEISKNLEDFLQLFDDKVKLCSEKALRCINKSRQLESTQSGKTLLIRDITPDFYKEASNTDIPKSFNLFVDGVDGVEDLPLGEQAYWPQSLWAHKLAAYLMWAKFARFKTAGEARNLSALSDFSSISIRPAIVMRWLQARDLSRRHIEGQLLDPGFQLTENGKLFKEYCISFDSSNSNNSDPGNRPPVLMHAYRICESLYFALLSTRIISRKNMDLIFPRMSQIYYVQWKVLYNLASALAADINAIDSTGAKNGTSTSRDIFFILQRLLVGINSESSSLERIPPTHFDYEYIYLRLIESLDSAASLADETSRARTGIFQNKYYCHDDYNDADFNFDYTLAYMFTPSAVFLRDSAEKKHKELIDAIVNGLE